MIADRIAELHSTLPQGVELVAVSKFHPAEAIMEAYNAGQRIFGESRVQELVAKIPLLPPDVVWHFIGHLQSNKVRPLLSTRRVALIESVDSFPLLKSIDVESSRLGIVTRVLLQVHVAAESTKFGFTPDELTNYFARGYFRNLRATHLCGIMAMATNTDSQERVASDFATAAEVLDTINEYCPDLEGFNTLSMGMSHDYPIAIAHGANLVRVGSLIFGDRPAKI
ncbi:MAG: YggS family pyridoxal phosphate-dependent enzyme [Muribaculaceae bacterium]|nr:YggS family pyridoxal phosphate-dependent enzyme [Muribaculaceae bacterium]